LKLLTTPEAMRDFPRQGTVALVPTMGALHAGHLALVEHARQLADTVVVSIYVNPLQFGPTEDFTRYPRQLDADMQALNGLADAVFAPHTLYDQAETTQVVPPAGLTHCLCGRSRPGHFTGVATVVLKLFQVVQPTVAIFGEKDFQQLVVLQRMVHDLNLPVDIVPHPTAREADGLAMSSRNVYLTTPQEREAARTLSQTLFALKAQAQPGQPLPPLLTHLAQKMLHPSVQLEYLVVVDPHTLAEQHQLTGPARALIAGRVGPVRLIDNIAL
jgi:pantoate--beta-alanine ligase